MFSTTMNRDECKSTMSWFIYIFFQPDTSMTVICDTEAFKEGGSRAYWLQYGRYMCDTVYGTADGFTSTF